jgi:hypothetical protein
MNAIRECGVPALLVLLLALAATVCGVVAIVLGAIRSRGAPYVSAAAAFVGACAVGTGFLGAAYGRARVDSVVDTGAVAPSMVPRLRAEGYREAGECSSIGAFVGGGPLLLGLVAVGLVFFRREGGPRTDARLR